MKTITMASLSLLLAVCATSASASYFFNSRWGTMLNVGSAPNPTPEQLRAIGDSRYFAARRGQLPSRALPLRPEPQVATLPFAPLVTEVTPTITMPVVASKVSVRQERRITAELNRASLTHAKAIASTATAAKATKVAATKAVSTKKVAAKALGNKRTAGKPAAPVKAARAKGKPAVKAAAAVANRRG